MTDRDHNANPTTPIAESTDHIVELAKIIQESVATLARACKEGNVTFPSLDDQFTPASEAFRANVEANAAATTITAAAFQLIANVMSPPACVGSLITGAYQAATVRVCLEANVTEILREAGPKGLHIDEIAEKAKLPAGKLGRIIRYLATRHVYKEVRPDVFANTRLSGVMDTGKSVDAIQANPAAKHDNTWGFPALLGMQLDETAKAAPYLWDALADPATAASVKVTDTAFNKAFNTNLSHFEWNELPEHSDILRRFNTAMHGVESVQPPDQIFQAYGWDALPQGSVVVDVAGGTGATSLALARKFKNLNVVLQDQPSVIAQAKSVFDAQLPDAIEGGQVTLQAHDFFEEQPVKNASVFILKQILHDWSDPYCVTILTRLREAAQPHTKLLVLDSLLQNACPMPKNDETSLIPGAVPQEAPAPLLANYGVANGLGYLADINMLIMYNAQERTIKEFDALLKSTGWKIVKVVRTDGVSNFKQPFIAVPNLDSESKEDGARA